MSKIICLAGLPRVGKDTASKYMLDCDLNAISYSFAMPFKFALCEMFGWNYEDFELDNKEEIDPKYGLSKRQAMEYIGSTIMRGQIRKDFPIFDKLVGDRIWTNRALDFIENNKHKNIIITDLRYAPEYEALSKIDNVVFVRIIRPNYKKLDSSKSYDINKMKFNYIINNDIEGNLLNFKNKVVKLFNQII